MAAWVKVDPERIRRFAETATAASAALEGRQLRFGYVPSVSVAEFLRLRRLQRQTVVRPR